MTSDGRLYEHYLYYKIHTYDRYTMLSKVTGKNICGNGNYFVFGEDYGDWKIV